MVAVSGSFWHFYSALSIEKFSDEKKNFIQYIFLDTKFYIFQVDLKVLSCEMDLVEIRLI
jgi:hypothetical protein